MPDGSKYSTLWDFIRPALGYMSVAFICVIAGNSLTESKINFGLFDYHLYSISLEQFLYLILLIPAFVVRVTMYEQDNHKDISNIDPEWKKISWQLPRVIFCLCLFLFLYQYFIAIEYGFEYVIKIERLWVLSIGIAPFYLQTTITWRKWVKNDHRMFDFRYYIFFPALSTCIISFIVGWSQLNTYLIAIPSILITIYYLWSLAAENNPRTNWKLPDWIFLFLFLIFFVGGYIYANNFEQYPITLINMENSFLILLSSFMMTLIMGLTETWWFVKDKKNMHKLQKDHKLEFYNKRLNQFSIYLPLIMVLTIFDQHINKYFYIILAYSILLTIIWAYFQNIQNQYWSTIRLILGIILPPLFAISLRDYGEIELYINNKTILNGIPVAALLLSVFLNVVMRGKKSDISKEKKRSIIIVAAMIIILWALPQAFNVELSNNTIEKINLLQIFYFIVLIILLVSNIGDNSIENLVQKDRDDDAGQRSTNTLLMFIASGRLPISILSGIFPYLIVYQQTQAPILTFICIFPIVLVTMLGFIFNDIFDKEKDYIAGKKRPITVGKLPVHIAYNLSIVTIILIIILEILLNTYSSLIVLLLTLFLVGFYSLFSRKYPILKGFYTAVLCCAPILYGYEIVEKNIEIIKLLPIVIFIVGREIWLDKIDLPGDLKLNLKTIPYYLGKKNSVVLAFLLMFLGEVILISLSQTLGIYIGVLSCLILGACAIIQIKDEQLAVQMSRISMLAGVLALIL